MTTTEDIRKVLHVTRNGMAIDIEVTPGAKRSGAVSINPWRGRLEVSVRSPPMKGAANKEVIQVLASVLGVPRTDIAILSGAKGSKKRVEVIGLTMEGTIKALTEALD